MQAVNSRRKAKHNLFEAWLFRLAPLPDFLSEFADYCG